MHNPSEMPAELEEVEEPYIRASIIVPKEYVCTVMELNNERKRQTSTTLEMVSLSGCISRTTCRWPRSCSTTTTSSSRARAATRTLRLRPLRVHAGQPRAGRRARRDEPVGCALADRPPRVRLRPRPAARREAARGDPAGRCSTCRSRPRSASRVIARETVEGAPQGRAREVLRRRHLPQAQAAREAEEGQEADEAGRRGGGAAGGHPRGAQPRRGARRWRVAGRAPSRCSSSGSTAPSGSARRLSRRSSSRCYRLAAVDPS